jgi:hypothetical protein
VLPSPPLPNEPGWEVCEIVCEVETIGMLNLFKTVFANQVKGKFKAQANGPNGIFVAGKTAQLPVRLNNDNADYPRWPESVQAVNGLVDELVREGWERTNGRGPHWFSHQLRRKVEADKTR